MPLPVDYLIHWTLELLGGGACACATSFCKHRVLSAVVWLLFSVASTIATVQIVG